MLLEDNEIRVQASGGFQRGVSIIRHAEDAMAEGSKLRGEMPGDRAFLLRNQDTQWPQDFPSLARRSPRMIHYRNVFPLGGS